MTANGDHHPKKQPHGIHIKTGIDVLRELFINPPRGTWMPALVIDHFESRWAVQIKLPNKEAFWAGKYCWNDATDNEPVIRTFRTRKLCREAINQMNSYSEFAQAQAVVLVTKKH